jgi:hypothetical protein
MWEKNEDVIGCGLLMDPNDALTLFFTLNGILLGELPSRGIWRWKFNFEIGINSEFTGRPFPISPTVDHLFPTVQVYIVNFDINFGYDPAIPFKYNTKRCSGLSYEENHN